MSEEKKTIRVRIQNDGTHSYDTRVTDVETGQEISHITSLTYTNGDLNEECPYPRAEITVAMPAVIDVIVDAEIRHVCPVCGRSVEEQSEMTTHDMEPPIEDITKAALKEMARQLRMQGAARSDRDI